MGLRHSFKRRGPRINVSSKELRTVDGILFASRGEADRYVDLIQAQRQGAVVMFLRQPRFDIGGGTKFSADFIVFWDDGAVTIEDVKGHRTDRYIRAKKQVEALYPITITEIKV